MPVTALWLGRSAYEGEICFITCWVEAHATSHACYVYSKFLSRNSGNLYRTISKRQVINIYVRARNYQAVYIWWCRSRTSRRYKNVVFLTTQKVFLNMVREISGNHQNSCIVSTQEIH